MSKYSDCFSSLQQPQSVCNFAIPVKGEEEVDAVTRGLPDSLVHAVQFIAYPIFDRLDFYLLNYEMLTEKETWSELDKLRRSGNAPPLF